MNKQIKELADKAGVNLWQTHLGDVTHYEGKTDSLEKFAKLIIKECVNRIQGCHLVEDGRTEFELGYRKAIDKATNQVLLHFGLDNVS